MGSTRFLIRFAKALCNSYISSSSSSSSSSSLLPPILQTISLTGFHRRRSIHSGGGGGGLVKTHVFVESDDGNRRNSITVDDDDVVDNQRRIDIAAMDIEKLCKILSNHSCDSSPLIELSLDHSGVSVVSSEVVEQVLKKLSNAGVLALSFFRWAEKQKGFKPTTEIYHALIESLGKIKQFKLIWILVNSMKVKGLLNKDTFALIERRYARARKINEAVEAFERMESRYGFKLELADFNKLLDTLCKSRNVKKAQEVFDEMSKRKKRFIPDLKTYTILLEGWGQEGNMVILKEIFRELKDEGHEPDVVTYGIIINAYCKSRKYDEALEMFRAMKCKPSPHIYCTLINGLGSDKRLDEAMELFEQSKTIGEFVPEIPTYNAVVGAYCWSARLHDAYRVVDEMRRNGVGPNARTYEIILHHLIKCGRRKEAYSVFQRMGSDEEFGVEPSLNTYTMIIRMLCNEERVDLGVKLWDEMKAKGILPSMALFSTLINSLCVVDNKLDDACKYFEEMLKMGIRPPGLLYSNLKQALLDAGMKDEAVNLGLKLDRIRKTPLVG